MTSNLPVFNDGDCCHRCHQSSAFHFACALGCAFNTVDRFVCAYSSYHVNYVRRTPDEATRQAVTTAIIATAESAGVTVPLLDPDAPTMDLTSFAEKGREVITAAPPPAIPGQPQVGQKL